MLFKTTDGIRAFCPTFSGALKWSVVSPVVSLAELQSIIPAIGQELYTDLESKFQDNTITGKTSILLGELQRALSFYTSYQYMNINGIQHNDAGTFENSPGNAQVTRQWQFHNACISAITIADDSLDRALAYLEANASDFTVWKESPAYTISKELFITNAIDLTRLGVNINNSRSAYLAIRPYIKIAEESYIIPAIGQPMYDKLKADIIEGSISSANKRLIDMIRRPLALLSLVEAIPFINVVVTGTGLKVISTNDAITQKVLAGDKEKSNIMQAALTNGNAYLVALKKAIEEAPVGVYPEFDTSVNKGNNEPPTDVPDNSNIKTFRIN